MSTHTCSLCGLRYPAQTLLDLHIREDHAQRAGQPAAPEAPEAPAAPVAPAATATPAAPADTLAPPPRSPAPGTERLSWAETARRALNRMIGREPADPPNRAA
jgi:hypothetical protein